MTVRLILIPNLECKESFVGNFNEYNTRRSVQISILYGGRSFSQTFSEKVSGITIETIYR